MKLAWGNKVSKEFRDTWIKICRDFSWTNDHASWGMAIFAWEGNEEFSAKTKNLSGSSATGFLQVIKNTAEKQLHLYIEDIEKMTPEEYLVKVVKPYFEPYAKKLNNLSDMYMSVFSPKFIGMSEDTKMYLKGTDVAYKFNSGLDTDFDGIIEIKEAVSPVEQKLAKGFGYGYWTEEEDVSQNNSNKINSIIINIEKELAELKSLLN